MAWHNFNGRYVKLFVRLAIRNSSVTDETGP